ncbi:hypothetical protein DOTSEDRAFT_72018, partial [Dothistroma septosporum NZE10]
DHVHRSSKIRIWKTRQHGAPHNRAGSIPGQNNSLSKRSRVRHGKRPQLHRTGCFAGNLLLCHTENDGVRWPSARPSIPQQQERGLKEWE